MDGEDIATSLASIHSLCRSESFEMRGKEKVYLADGSETGTATSKRDKSKKRCKAKCSLICEVLLLTPIMLIVIGLFCLPTVFYVLDPSAAEVN